MASRSGYRSDILLFAGIALSYLAAAALISRAMGFFVADPDYQYMMNGHNLLLLHAPNYFYHPGTPVQAIIALVMGLTWVLTLPWHGLSNIQDEILGHPQFYLACVNAVFACAIAAAIIFFAWSVRKACGSILPALAGLFSLFSAFAIFMTFHHVMPEPVLLGASLILSGLLAGTAYAPDDAPEPWQFAAAVGVLLGFCITAKVTSAPLLLAIFFLRSGRSRMTAAAACGVAAFVFLIPILPRWPVLLRSYLHILTHRGDYGSGGAGAPSLPELLANLHDLRGADPELFLGPALFVATILVCRIQARPLPRNMARALLLCTAVICAGLLMTAKQPHPYYLTPVAAFLCLGNALVAALLFRNWPNWVRIAVVAVLAMFAFHVQYRLARSYAAEDPKAYDDLAAVEADRGCFTIVSYGTLNPQFSLFFGSMSSGQRYADRLANLYPDFLAYKTDTGTFQTFSQQLSRDTVEKRLSAKKCADLMGSAWQPNYGIDARFLKIVAHSSGIYLYELQPGWDRH